MCRCLVFVLLLITKPFLIEAKPVVVAISDFPPWINVSEEYYGVHGAIVIRALQKAKVPYEIKISSWARIRKMLSSEDVCSFGFVKNKERLAKWQYSRPYHTDKTFLWGRKNNRLELNNIQDAAQYRLAVTSGYSYGQEFDEFLSHMETDESLNDTINLRKLLAGRIDLFPGQIKIIKPLMATQFPDQIDELEPKIQINQLNHHFVCNKNSETGKQVIQKINRYLPVIAEQTNS